MELSIKKQILFILLFAASLLFQVAVTKYFSNFPDLSLLVIVFGGIYFFGIEIIFLVVIVSFIRGFFSQETLVVDVFLMPCVCLVSYFFSKMFNRENIFFQALITVISFIMIIAAHILYFNISTGNYLSVMTFIVGSWKKIFLTSLMAPIVFLIYREYFRIRW